MGIYGLTYSLYHPEGTVGGDGGCRVGEVRAGTTSPMPDHKGFKLQLLVNFQKFSTLRVNQYYIKLKLQTSTLDLQRVYSLHCTMQSGNIVRAWVVEHGVPVRQ